MKFSYEKHKRINDILDKVHEATRQHYHQWLTTHFSKQANVNSSHIEYQVNELCNLIIPIETPRDRFNMGLDMKPYLSCDISQNNHSNDENQSLWSSLHEWFINRKNEKQTTCNSVDVKTLVGHLIPYNPTGGKEIINEKMQDIDAQQAFLSHIDPCETNLSFVPTMFINKPKYCGTGCSALLAPQSFGIIPNKWTQSQAQIVQDITQVFHKAKQDNLLFRWRVQHDLENLKSELHNANVQMTAEHQHNSIVSDFKNFDETPVYTELKLVFNRTATLDYGFYVYRDADWVARLFLEAFSKHYPELSSIGNNTSFGERPFLIPLERNKRLASAGSIKTHVSHWFHNGIDLFYEVNAKIPSSFDLDKWSAILADFFEAIHAYPMVTNSESEHLQRKRIMSDVLRNVQITFNDAIRATKGTNGSPINYMALNASQITAVLYDQMFKEIEWLSKNINDQDERDYWLANYFSMFQLPHPSVLTPECQAFVFQKLLELFQNNAQLFSFAPQNMVLNKITTWILHWFTRLTYCCDWQVIEPYFNQIEELLNQQIQVKDASQNTQTSELIGLPQSLIDKWGL